MKIKELKRENVRNILAVRNDRFGEFLLNIPAFRALKETFVNARLTVVVQPYVSPLAACVPYLDEVIEWGAHPRSLRTKWGFIGALRAKHFDIAVMLNPSKEFNIYTFLSGIPYRIGYARKWPFLLTRTIPDEKHLAKMHEVEYNLQIVSVAGAHTRDASLFLFVPEVTPDFLRTEYGIGEEGPIIAVHPFTSDPVKQWPLERFVQLAETLVREMPVTVAIIGGKEESVRSREIFGSIAGKRIIDLTGKTGLVGLAGLLKRCSLLISGDSGPVHLACCVKTPVIVLFRNDLPGKTPQRWGPWGRGNAVIERDKLEKITVNEVIENIKNQISKIKNKA
jgi:heptosyltransferase-2